MFTLEKSGQFWSRQATRARLRRLSFCSNERGAAAVEMALVATPFLALLIAALQLGLVYLSQSELEIATEKTARSVLTGATQTAGLTQKQFLAAICSDLPALMSCSNVLVDAQAYSSFSDSNTSAPKLTYDSRGNLTNKWSYNIGGPNDIVVLRVLYLLPVIGTLDFNITDELGNTHLLMATAVFKNEPHQ